MASSEPPHDAPSPAPADESSHFTVEGLFRVTRAFLIPFLLSWAISYLGGEWGNEPLYFGGLCGVGLSVIGLLLWLLHH